MVLRYGLSELSTMTRCSIMNNGTSLRLNTLFGMILSCTPRQHGISWSSKSTLASFRLKLCSKALTKRTRVLRISFVEGTIWKSLGIGNGNTTRYHNSWLVNLVAWGLSLAGGLGVVLGLVGLGGLCPWWGCVGVTFYVTGFVCEGPHLPLKWARFPLLHCASGVEFSTFSLQIK